MKRPALLAPSVRILAAIGLAALLLLAFVATPNHTRTTNAQVAVDGTTAQCTDFTLSILGLFTADLPDPGWVWVKRGLPGEPQFVNASGEVVTESQFARTDFPDVHDSHDFFFNIRTDPGQEHLLSMANSPNEEGGTVATFADLETPTELHLEWEAGILPDEFSGDGSAHFFPKWAWPSEGDRVWANGDWIFDCGHPTEITDTGDKIYRSEIHPMRAIASMRQQMRTLPGSGTTPVAVTATDLYIHGRNGFAADMMDCGAEILLGPTPDCPDGTPFGDHDPVTGHHARPINEDFDFDVCLPPLPFDKAPVAVFMEDGPGNTVTDPALAPVVSTMPSVGPCAADPAKYGPVQAHVHVPLGGSSVTPDDVYARRIYAGWVFPSENLRHFQATLTLGDMHDDQEHPDPLDISDCECAFFFANLDRAPDEWGRLSDFDHETCQSSVLDVCVSTNTIDDWDDDQDIGNGELDFSGPTFDFFVGNNQPYTIRVTGFDGGVGEDFPLNDDLGVDCLDNHFGEHDFGSHVNLSIFPPEFPSLCYAFLAITESGPDNDAFNELEHVVNPPYVVGDLNVANPDNQYDLTFNIQDVPLAGTVEDTADLSIIKDCKPNSNALAGEQFTCTIIVQNSGPGLPRHVVVDDVLLTDVDPSDYTMEPPTFTFPGVGFDDPCITPDNPIDDLPGGKEFRCDIGTVPVGGKAIITVKITSNEGGDFNNFAHVFTDSTDSNPANDQSQDSINVLALADLSITKSDSEDPLVSGTSLTYSLLIHNSGPSTAVNVHAEDLLPAGVSIDSVSGTGGAACVFGVPGDNSRPTVCTFGSIPSGGSRTMTVVVTVLPGIHNSLHNDARVSSDVLDLNNANDVDSEDTQIRVTDLQIVKTSDADVYKSSATVAYTLTVHNNGPADAQNVVVTDDLPLTKQDRVIWMPGSPTCSKPVGGTLLTCDLGTIPAGGTKTISVLITFKGSRGTVSNTANVTTTTTDYDLANNSSTKLVQVGTLPKP